jgi:hypothetical protein
VCVCVDDVASLGYVAVRATVNMGIVFYMLLRKNIGLKRRGLIFTVHFFFVGNTSSYACVFVV